jgi:hypothetical protein
MLVPRNIPLTPIDKFDQIEAADTSKMTAEELGAHRKMITSVQKHLKGKLGETATTVTPLIEEDEVRRYIENILLDAAKLVPTELSDFPLFRDSQNVRWYQGLIKECVTTSPFGEKQFRVKELSYQRRAIEKSKTLHELRQNVKAIIGPLSLHRNNIELKADLKREQDDSSLFDEIDNLIKENFEKDKKIKEQQRVLDASFALYDPDMTRWDKHKAIEDYKATNHCSDRDAATVFCISERTIKRLRSEFRGRYTSPHIHQSCESKIHSTPNISEVDVAFTDDSLDI